MLFSQREGYKKIRDYIQEENIDSILKNALWNELTMHYWSLSRSPFLNTTKNPVLLQLITDIWKDYFKYTIDEINSYWNETLAGIKRYFFGCPWYEQYDFIEFIANNDVRLLERVNESFIIACNNALEKEMSGYRFVNKVVVKTTSDEEIMSIEEVIENTKLGKLKTVNNHIARSLELMADRKTPDYRNSIKESISAVEAMCQIITSKEKATLGQAIKELEKVVEIHPALKEAFSKLYGYTSDADGIRHALQSECNLSYEDAKYMLVTCSAFINYLIGKKGKLN